MTLLESLVALLVPAKHILVFTGAGISTASGIPDFRGPQGIWKRRQPVYFQEFMASEEKRKEYWEYKAEAFGSFRDAQPNSVHKAIARLQKLDRLLAVVTQNIDGLHQAAGSSEEIVIELHGTNRWVECVACRTRSEPSGAVASFLAERRTPTCACGGWLKFATISFGQALEPATLDRAFRAAATADLVLALGSTLSVHPAASVPMAAARRGVSYVIVNQGETDQDSLATLRIEGAVGDFVPAAVEALS